MPARVAISEFFGARPRVSKRLIKDGDAQRALNCSLVNGDLRPLYRPLVVKALAGTGTVQTIFRMYDATTDYWLSFTDDVDVVRVAVPGDTSFRTAFSAASFEPRITNLALATTGAEPFPVAWYVLGVFAPTTAPTVTPVGGSGAQEARAYVYTYVTPWGEESASSPASAVLTNFVNATWQLTAMQTAPANSFTVTGASWAGGVATYTVASTFGLRVGEYVTIIGITPTGYNVAKAKITALAATTASVAVAVDPGAWAAGGTITRDAPHNTAGMVKRIYRTAAGGTTFYFVAEIAVATTTYNDTVVSVNEALETIGWLQPPTDLRGLVMTSSGALAGFSGNELCFSEPSAPYAWPDRYRQAVDYPIVAIGAYGQNVVVGTSGNPFIGSGVEPETVVMDIIKEPWPCVSKRGLVTLDNGVSYPTKIGLAFISAAVPQLITSDLYTRDEWRSVYPESMAAAAHDGRYYCIFQSSPTTNQQMLNIVPEGPYVVESDVSPSAIYADPNGKLYVVDDNIIHEWDANIAVVLDFDWKSKEFTLVEHINLGIAKIDADFVDSPADAQAAAAAYAAQLAANQTMIANKTSKGSLNAYSLGLLSVNGSLVKVPNDDFDRLTFELYWDNALKFTRAVYDKEMFRLPAGTKYDNFYFRLIGNVRVRKIAIATTVDELRAV